MERALTIRSSRARFAVSVVTGPHRAARLNSGVSSQKKWFSAKSFLFAKAKELPCSTLARAPAYLGPDTPPRGDAFLGFKTTPSVLVIARTAGFSELTIRSSRARFAASAPAVMIEPPPRPLIGPA